MPEKSQEQRDSSSGQKKWVGCQQVEVGKGPGECRAPWGSPAVAVAKVSRCFQSQVVPPSRAAPHFSPLCVSASAWCGGAQVSPEGRELGAPPSQPLRPLEGSCPPGSEQWVVAASGPQRKCHLLSITVNSHIYISAKLEITIT